MKAVVRLLVSFALLAVVPQAWAGSPAAGAPAPVVCALRAVAAGAGGALGIYRTDAPTAGEAALTFDDGPMATATPRILDMLAARSMKATFFVVGRNISRHTYAAVRRMVADGHTVGSHCYTHDIRMTDTAAPERTVATIRAQHEVTAVLVDIALLAKSGDDFDALHRRVLGHEAGAWISAAQLRGGLDGILARHRVLLGERGFGAGQRPYPVVYARPPGGGPYEARGDVAGVALYDRALRELGMINVMWHGGAGDTDLRLGRDVRFLTGNLTQHARRGGVLLIHDSIVPEALAGALDRMAADRVRITGVEAFVQRKYGCAPAQRLMRMPVEAS